jgi:hypothetical protein
VETTIATTSCKIVTPRARVLYQPHTRSTRSITTPGGEVDVDGLVVGDDQAGLSVEGFELHRGRNYGSRSPSDAHANGGTVTTDGHGPITSTFGSAPTQPLVTTNRIKMPRRGRYSCRTYLWDVRARNRVGRICGTYVHRIVSGVSVGRKCTEFWQRGAFDEHFFGANWSCTTEMIMKMIQGTKWKR